MSESEVAMQATAAGTAIQEGLDDALVPPRGMFTQTSMNALVDAVNQALTVAGFEGSVPEVDSNLTEFPVELVRVLAMLNDAAQEAGLEELEFSQLEDDRDVAMLASAIARVAAAPEFAAAMEAPSDGADMALPSTPPPAAAPMMGAGAEEALMMERM